MEQVKFAWLDTYADCQLAVFVISLSCNREKHRPQLEQLYMHWGLTEGQLRSCDGTTKIHAKQEVHLLVVRKCNTFVHIEENESPGVVQQMQGLR